MPHPAMQAVGALLHAVQREKTGRASLRCSHLPAHYSRETAEGLAGDARRRPGAAIEGFEDKCAEEGVSPPVARRIVEALRWLMCTMILPSRED